MLDCKSWSYNNPYVLTTSNCLSLMPLCDILCHMELCLVDLGCSLSRSALILCFVL